MAAFVLHIALFLRVKPTKRRRSVQAERGSVTRSGGAKEEAPGINGIVLKCERAAAHRAALRKLGHFQK